MAGEIKVHLNSARGAVVTSVQSTDGHFAFDVPAARYVLTGHSSPIRGHGQTCDSITPRTVAAGASYTINIYCEVR